MPCAPSQRASQKPSRPASNATAIRLISVACLLGFLPPAIQQVQQCALVDRELLQRLALDARHNAGNKPTREAHLDHGDQRAVRFKRSEASAQVIQLLHGGSIN